MAKYQFTSRIQFTDFELEQNNKIYNSFFNFRDIFLEKGLSIFDESLELLNNDDIFKEYEQRIIKNYDASKKHSIEKYTLQLRGANKKFRHFFSTLVYLYLLPIGDMHQKTKIEEVSIYLDEDNNTEKLLELLPSGGFANYGNLMRFKYANLNFIYFFVKEYVRNRNYENPNDIINNLNSYELTKKLTQENINNVQALATRHMLNYLFNPDEYEPIVDTSAKIKIVKKFLGKANQKTLDKDLLKIRKETYGFDKSLYHVLDESKKDLNIASVISYENHPKNSINLSLTRQDDNDGVDDILDREKLKVENGAKAEKLVYNQVLSSLDKTQKSYLINFISKKYNLNISSLQQNIDKFLHYSKYIDIYSPFDIITLKDDKILYLEVKSTTSNIIFFSKYEIMFAAENLESYQVKVVKNNTIYDINLENEILEAYELLTNNVYRWSFNQIEIKVNFDN